jgi:hypothetical protein
VFEAKVLFLLLPSISSLLGARAEKVDFQNEYPLIRFNQERAMMLHGSHFA